MGYLAAFEVSSGNAPTSAAALGSGLAVSGVTSAVMFPAITWTSGLAPSFGIGETWAHVIGGGNAPAVVLGGTVAYPG